MDEQVLESLAEAVLAGFSARYVARASFDADRALCDELTREARPAAESLCLALALETTDDVVSLGHHESLAMVSLLGRRAAFLDASPTSASHLVPCLVDAIDDTGFSVPESAHGALSTACLEGYVGGREELVRERAASAAAASLPSLGVARGIRALFLSGRHDADELSKRVEDFGRELHRHDTRICIVDLSGLTDANRRRALAVLALDESARMLGVECIFSGTSLWESAFDEAEAPRVSCAPSFQEALELAYRSAGLSLKPDIAQRVRDLLGR